MGYKPIQFHEGEYSVRTLVSKEDHLQAFKLRHKVYAEKLAWVPSTPEGLEVDRFDLHSTTIGLFLREEKLLGLIRLLPPDHPFMLEVHFLDLVRPDYAIRKEWDTVEITRLTLVPTGEDTGLSASYFKILLKGLYQWSVENHIRYAFMEVEKRFWRILNRLGFLSTPIGPVKRLPPAYAESMASLLDWENFRFYNRTHQPDFLEWISRAQLSSVPLQWPAHDPVMSPEVLRGYYEHENLPSAR